MQQARAIRTRRGRRRLRLPGLRAPFVGLLLSLLAFLSPDLTLAPLNAGEPHRARPMPIDLLEVAPSPSRVQPIDADPLPAPTSTPTAPPDTGADYAAAIEAARTTAGARGITFAAVRDGQLLWSGAAGRDREGDARLAADDPLVIGSVTKTFVAATVLQMVEEGRLDLDDRLREHLPDLRRFAGDVSIRQLLDHTSGLADVFNDTTRRGLEEHPEHPWTSAEILASVHAPWYEPGKGWAYANTNYYLLGLLVERIGGATLADEIGTRFLEPLGLSHTRVLTGTEEGGPLSPAWATIFWGSGAMSASAADLARWGDALYGSDLLTEASLEAMSELNDHDYGLGVQRIELPNAVGYGHTGLLNTYTTLLVHLPEADVTLALLVNRSHVDLGAMLAAEAGDGPSLLELATGS
ncbi:MAG: beta-lactamase family protein [Chloroflexi bacterium]|nr:beta-lactamase family protein [Chloroflexota bacterium]